MRNNVWIIWLVSVGVVHTDRKREATQKGMRIFAANLTATQCAKETLNSPAMALMFSLSIPLSVNEPLDWIIYLTRICRTVTLQFYRGVTGGIFLIPSAAEGRDGQSRLKWQFPWLPCREMSLYISSDTSQNTQTQLSLSPWLRSCHSDPFRWKRHFFPILRNIALFPHFSYWIKIFNAMLRHRSVVHQSVAVYVYTCPCPRTFLWSMLRQMFKISSLFF